MSVGGEACKVQAIERKACQRAQVLQISNERC